MTTTTTAPEASEAPRGLPSLRGTGFGRLWASAAASNLADGVLFAGLPVLATFVTDSPFAIGAVTFAIMGPMAALALPSGVVADRADRRRLLVLGNLGRAIGLLAALVAVAIGELQLAVIYAAAVVGGSSEVLVDTTAQTATTAVVPRARWDAANARLVGTQLVGNNAVGAPIGSTLAAVGALAVLGAAAGGYALAAALVVGLRSAGRAGRTVVRTDEADPVGAADADAAGAAAPGAFERLRHDIGEGVRFLRGEAVLGRIAVTGAVLNLGNTAFGAVSVLIVTDRLGLPVAAYGLFGTVLALGGVVGSAGAERLLRRVDHATAMRGALAVMATSYGVLAVTRTAGVAGVALFTLGATAMAINVASRSLRQALTPSSLLGRVTASAAAITLVATPVGALVGGAVAELAGLAAIGFVTVGTQIAGLVVLRRVTPTTVAAARARAASEEEPS